MNAKLREKIRKNFGFLAAIREEKVETISYREAAYVMGLQRLKQRLMKTWFPDRRRGDLALTSPEWHSVGQSL